MKTLVFHAAVLVALLAPTAFSAEPKVDIRNGIPMDATVAMYGQHNSERDQQEYDAHVGAAARRAEFNTTARELTDIPRAATHGAMQPAAASGTIVML